MDRQKETMSLIITTVLTKEYDKLVRFSIQLIVQDNKALPKPPPTLTGAVDNKAKFEITTIGSQCRSKWEDCLQ